MNKIMKTKIGLGLIGSVITLSLAGSIYVNALSGEVPKENEHLLKIDGPYFYELDHNETKTSYKYDKDKDTLLRYQKELTDFQLGQSLRTRVHVENTSSSNQKMKLITVLEDLAGKQDDILKISDVSEIQAHHDQDVCVDVKIPDSGDYHFKVYIWDDLNGMKALKDTTILADGASALRYEYDGEYNRDNPQIVLNWKGNDKAESYDIYVENKVVANVKETSYHMKLKPYTPYKISVQARLKNGQLTAHSNTLYFMSEDTSSSQDKRMKQWNEDRFGMFIHWGGYAAFGGVYQGQNVSGETINYDSAGGGNGAYSEWIKFGAQIPDDIYKKTVEQKFTAENYNPQEWVQIAKKAGMKYIVLTSKHHEGLALFQTAAKHGWSVQDTQAKFKLDQLQQKDFVKELIYEAEKEGIRVGVYYSQAIDWAQPGSIGWTPQRQSQWSQTEIEKLKKDIVASGVSQDIVDKKIWDILGGAEYEDIVKMNEDVILTQIKELMTMKVDVNGKKVGIDTLWWDMGQDDYPEFNYQIMKTVAKLDPEKKIKLNNRLLHQDQYTTMPYDFVTPEQNIPEAPKSKYWETCMTMNQNWGYAKNDHLWKDADELVHNLSRIASMGGNFLLNVGPKPDGSFPDEAKDLLAQVGQWMDQNGEAIYGTCQSPFLNHLDYGYATQKGNKVYLHVYDSNSLNQLIIPGLKTQPQNIKVITDKNTYQNISFQRCDDYKGYQLTEKVSSTNAIATIIVLEFNQSPEFEKCDKAFPVIQDAKTHHAVFKPSQATVVGNSLKVENNGDNFGYWNDENDYAKWEFKALNAGLYAVKANYATDNHGQIKILLKDQSGKIIDEVGSEFEKSADQDFWVSYKELTVGALNIPAAGEYTVEIHRGPGASVNIRNLEFIPLSEVLESQSLTNLLQNQNGLRNAALGQSFSEVSYGLKGHIYWKISLDHQSEMLPILTMASHRNDVKIALSLRDKNGQLINDRFVEATLRTDDWSLVEVSANGKMDFSGLTGEYYLDLQVVEGEMNFKDICFVEEEKIKCLNSDSVVFDDGYQTINLQTNINSDCQVLDDSLIDVEKVNDKEYKITAKVNQDGATKIVLSSTLDKQNKIEIPVIVMDGHMNHTKSSQIEKQDIPENYSILTKNGTMKLEQDIQKQVIEEGKGIYKLEMIYKTPVNTKFAIGVNGNWMSGDLITEQWTRTFTYIDLREYENGEILIKPFDNFTGIEDHHEIYVSAVQVHKLGSNQEMVLNSTLSSEYIDRMDKWNRDNMICSLSIQLKAYQAQLLNVAGSVENNIVVEESDYRDYGKLGNWWDPEDSFQWNFEVMESGTYTIDIHAKRNFNDCPVHFIIQKDMQKIYEKTLTIVENQTSYLLDDKMYLDKGIYTIVFDRYNTASDCVPDFYGVNFLEVKNNPASLNILPINKDE